MNILKDALIQIVRDNKLFLVNDNTFICIKFKDKFESDTLKSRRGGVVERIYHINNRIPFTFYQNKFIQMVVGKLIRRMRNNSNGFNKIKLNDSTFLIFTPLYKGFSPVAVREEILDDATFLNLLMYYNEKYKSFFDFNFVDKTFKQIVLKKYFKSTKTEKYTINYKNKGNINDIDLEHLAIVYPLYHNKITSTQKEINKMPVVKSSKECKLTLEEIYNLFIKYTNENMEIKINNVKVSDIAYTETFNKMKCLVLNTYNGYVVYNTSSQITQMKAIPKEIQLL